MLSNRGGGRGGAEGRSMEYGGGLGIESRASMGGATKQRGRSLLLLEDRAPASNKIQTGISYFLNPCNKTDKNETAVE